MIFHLVLLINREDALYEVVQYEGTQFHNACRRFRTIQGDVLIKESALNEIVRYVNGPILLFKWSPDLQLENGFSPEKVNTRPPCITGRLSIQPS